MQVISFINMKGGVGKTTLAVNIAYGLASLYRKKVLIIDADPQFNATQYLLETDAYLRHTKDQAKGTLFDIFIPNRPGAVSTLRGRATEINRTNMPMSDCTCKIFEGGRDKGKLDLIPSTLTLMEIETSKRGTETLLKSYLRDKARGYDYVIIDCPPTISIFTQAAIIARDSYLVPIKPDPLSVIGLPLLQRWLEEFIYLFGLKIDLAGLVFTLVRSPITGRMRDIIKELREQRKDEVFVAQLDQANDVAKSVEEHLPVFKYRENSKTSNQIVQITQEFLDRTSGV
jgi:chromosome partitioning protein